MIVYTPEVNVSGRFTYQETPTRRDDLFTGDRVRELLGNRNRRCHLRVEARFARASAIPGL